MSFAFVTLIWHANQWTTNVNIKYFVLLVLLYDFRYLDVLRLRVPYFIGLPSPNQLLDSARYEYLRGRWYLLPQWSTITASFP